MASDVEKEEVIHTKIWQETASSENPFAADESYCSGYDVYGDLLKHASYIEYIYLLFKLEKPQPWQTHLLEKVAIAIANPGIRDHSVRAAMCAGVGGSTSASALMAALSVGAGQLNGAREVFTLVDWWNQCGTDLCKWKSIIEEPPRANRATVWSEFEHTPGFDPHGVECVKPVLQTLSCLADIYSQGNLAWLQENRQALESYSKSPLALSGVIATALNDIGFDSEQAEIVYLFLRLPGAAAHSLEQRQHGWKKYPFFGADLNITNDPGKNNEA